MITRWRGPYSIGLGCVTLCSLSRRVAPPSARLFHVKHRVRFIDTQARDLGFYAQSNLRGFAASVHDAIVEIPPHLDRDDPRLELLGRILYDSRKIDSYTSGRRSLFD